MVTPEKTRFYSKIQNIKLEKFREMCNLVQSRGGKVHATEYIDNNTIYEFECKNEHRWKTRYRAIKSGSWCPKCAADKKKYTLEYMQQLVAKKGWTILSNTYTNANTKMQVRCDKGHTWSVTPHKLSMGSGCPTCAIMKKRTRTREKLQHEVNRGNEFITTKYSASKVDFDLFSFSFSEIKELEQIFNISLQKVISNQELNEEIIEHVTEEIISKFPERLTDIKTRACVAQLKQLINNEKIVENTIENAKKYMIIASNDFVREVLGERAFNQDEFMSYMEVKLKEFMWEIWMERGYQLSDIKIESPEYSEVYIHGLAAGEKAFERAGVIEEELRKLDEWLGWEATVTDIHKYYPELGRAIYKYWEEGIEELRNSMEITADLHGYEKLPKKRQIINLSRRYWDVPGRIEQEYWYIVSKLGRPPMPGELQILNKNAYQAILIYRGDVKEYIKNTNERPKIKVEHKEEIPDLPPSKPKGYYQTAHNLETALANIDRKLGYKATTWDLQKMGEFGMAGVIKNKGGILKVRQHMATLGLSLDLPEKWEVNPAGSRTWTLEDVLEELNMYDESIGYKVSVDEISRALHNQIWKFGGVRAIREMMHKRGLSSDIPEKKDAVDLYETRRKWDLDKIIQIMHALDKKLGYKVKTSDIDNEYSRLNMMISRWGGMEKIRAAMEVRGLSTDIPEKEDPRVIWSLERIMQEIQKLDEQHAFKVTTPEIREHVALQCAVEKYGGLRAIRKEMDTRGISKDIPKKMHPNKKWTLEKIIEELKGLDEKCGYNANTRDLGDYSELHSAISEFGGLKKMRSIMQECSIDLDLIYRIDETQIRQSRNKKWDKEKIILEIGQLDQRLKYKATVGDLKQIPGLSTAVTRDGGMVGIRDEMDRRGINANLPKKTEVIDRYASIRKWTAKKIFAEIHRLDKKYGYKVIFDEIHAEDRNLKEVIRKIGGIKKVRSDIDNLI